MGRKGVRNARYKVKNRTRDIDQISNDLKEENVAKRVNEATELDEDKPGLGQFFCIFCDKYFIDQITLDLHKKQKPHKRRLKSLDEPVHTQDDADYAAGILKSDYKLPSKKLCISSDLYQPNIPSITTASYTYVE
uniref:Bud site selection protein 20 n=1 Tax=Schistosoma japonicum TaxID=6182 RepID=C1LHN4_SCHJA|nr:Bud site selection protein 20 [Schistosoma japonicum]